MSADLASLRIAEDRTEWAVECDNGLHVDGYRDKSEAARWAVRLDCARPDSGSHRVVSRRVITTEWAEQ